jgi:hypothetical protein
LVPGWRRCPPCAQHGAKSLSGCRGATWCVQQGTQVLYNSLLICRIIVQGATRPTGALSPLLPVACSRSVLLAKCSVALEGVAQVSLKVHRWVEGHLHGTCCLTDGLLVMAYTNVAARLRYESPCQQRETKQKRMLDW